ncbi:membrane protein [Arthrobacter phage SerialPhiller]|nr:hypothetical protein SEA_ARIELAGOS_17 [Arthrobacter phage Arielagos]WNT45249.1 membrane protein [Arthrobacter phage SerialPhiller]
MPDTEAWTPGETVRAIRSIGSAVERIENKLDGKITREDLDRSELVQAHREALQDAAIKDLEDNHSKLMFAAVGAGLSGAAGLLIALVTRAG